MSEEDQDYEGPWPREDAMTEWVMVPRNATPEMVSALDDFRNGPHSARAAYRAMLDAAPAAPQQAKPVAWLGINPRSGHTELCDSKPAPSVMRDFRVRPLYLHPPADEVQRLRAEVEALKAENAALASWQCQFTDGVTGLYHDGCGNAQCARDHLVVSLTGEVEALRAAAREVCEWADATQWALGNETGVSAAKLDALRAAIDAARAAQEAGDAPTL